MVVQVKMTIYVPKELAAEVKAELDDTNISRVCQVAFREELERVRARARVTARGFERVEAIDGDGQDVAFRGRQIGCDHEHGDTAYLTPKSAIAVVKGAQCTALNGRESELSVFNDFWDFAELRHGIIGPLWPCDELVAAVAEALGEKYVRELDI